MKWLVEIAVLVCVGFAPAGAEGINVERGVKKTPAAVPAGTNWSTLGVIADGKTDNAAALNALPTGRTIIGDCPAGGTIRANSQWFLQSSLTIYVRPGCTVTSYWAGNQGAGFLTQSNLNTAVTNVFIDGLTLINAEPLFTGKGLRFWVDHLTFTNFTLSGWAIGGYIRGSDQEWQGNIVNSGTKLGQDGVRFHGNSPKVATTRGRPANVWVHHSRWSSGDATFEVAPVCQPKGVWRNLDADDYLFENSYGQSYSADLMFVGPGAQNIGLSCTNSLTNITFRNISGSAGAHGIRVHNAFNTGVVSDITVSGATVDMSTQTIGAGAIQVRGYDSAAIRRIVIKDVVITNPNKRCVWILTNTTLGIVEDVTIDNVKCGSLRDGSLAAVIVQGTTRTTIRNSTLKASVGGAIQLGAQADVKGTHTAVSPTVSNNTLTGITNNSWGVRMMNVDGARVTGNTTTPASGTTRAIGIDLQSADGTSAGTINSIVTGNNVSAIKNGPPIVCAPAAQRNTVTGNTGATDCR